MNSYARRFESDIRQAARAEGIALTPSGEALFYEAAIRYLRTHGVHSRAAVLRYFAEADRANAGAEYDRQVAPPAHEAP